MGRARAGEIVHFRTWTPGRSLAATRSRKLGDFDTYGRHEAVHRPPTAFRRPRQDVKRPARAGARRKVVARQGKGCHRRPPRMRLDVPIDSARARCTIYSSDTTIRIYSVPQFTFKNPIVKISSWKRPKLWASQNIFAGNLAGGTPLHFKEFL